MPKFAVAGSPAQPTPCIEQIPYPKWVAGWGAGPSSSIVAVEVVDDVAYLVALGDEFVGPSLYLVDVSNPEQPDYVRRLALPFDATDIVVLGTHAYVVGWIGTQLSIIDVAQPTQPEVVETIETPYSQTGIETDGDALYLTGPVMQVLDLGEPTTPALRSTGPRAHRIAIADDYLFASGSDSLTVLDISSPDSVQIIAQLEVEDIADVCVSGDFVYASRHVLGPAMSNVTVFDVSAPSRPVEVGMVDVGRDAKTIEVDGDMVYVSGRQPELVTVDVSEPTLPRVVGRVYAEAFYEIEIVGSHAFLADGSMSVLDVTGPASPSILGASNEPIEAIAVATQGQHAFVCDRYRGLLVFDTSASESPQLVGSVAMGDARSIALEGGVAFVADADQGLVVVDVRDPKSPVVRAIVPTEGASQDVAIHQGYAYVADGVIGPNYNDGGVQVIDVSNPFQPNLVNTVRFTGSATLVEISHDRAFVFSNRLRIFDLTEPGAPVEVGPGTTGIVINGMVFHDGLLYATANVGGHAVVSLDVAEPADVRIVGQASLPKAANGIDASGDQLFVASRRAGLWAVNIFAPDSLVVTAGVLAEAWDVSLAGGSAYVAADTEFMVAPTFCAPDDTTGTEDPPEPPEDPPVPTLTVLGAPYPTPTSDRVAARLSLGQASNVQAMVFDAAGRRVATLVQHRLAEGSHVIEWKQVGCASGVYYLRVEADGRTMVRRVVLAR